MNISAPLTVDGNINVNGELIINGKSIDETLDNRIEPIEDLHLSADYTAFEVFPTTEDIPAGNVSDVKFNGDVWSSSSTFIKHSVVYHESSNTVYKCLIECKGIEPNVTENWQNYWQVHDGFSGQFYKYLVDIPAKSFCKNRFYSYAKTREECDIVIDWGDGTVNRVADLNDNSCTLTYHGDVYGYSSVYVSHTYSDEDCGNKYIVKIYGKDYFMLRAGNAEANNIVCRVFDADLPMSSNIMNISSCFRNSLRLFKVIVPYGYRPLNDNVNITGLFWGCKNLRYCDFDNFIANRPYELSQIFRDCQNLECDINNFNSIFMNGSYNQNYGWAFRFCYKLYGVINPKVYWQNPSNDYYYYGNTKSYEAFLECAENIREQVPVSWGGTNKYLDVEIKLNQLKVDKKDYTAFEVFPTKAEIPAGTVSDTIVYGEYWEGNTAYAVDSHVLVKNQEKIYTCIKAVAKTTSIEPGVTEGWEEYWVEGNEHFDGYYYNYTVAVPANNVINVRFLAYSKTREECDIVIDWGDGTISRVADLNDKSITSFTDYQDYYNDNAAYSSLSLSLKHTYTDCVSRIENGKLVESKKYIVKIYGKDYFMLRCNNAIDNNIVSRIFDRDLPVASNVTNMSSAVTKSYRLLHCVLPYGYKDTNNITNMQSLFATCTNLRYCDFNNYTVNYNLFDARYLFMDCVNLECDINNFNNIFCNGVKQGYNLEFARCAKLYGIINPKVYWDNIFLNAYDASQTSSNNFTTKVNTPFGSCSAAIKAQVPQLWGGTKA